MATNNRTNFNADSKFNRYLLFFTIVSLLISLVIILGFDSVSVISCLLLSLACLFIGGFAGFLFGIPKVLQGNINNIPVSSTSAPIISPGTNRQELNELGALRVNTNLEEISDWLTKIIVGLGLINLKEIPILLRGTSILIAESITIKGSPLKNVVFANSLILFFPILGFLIGYLVTRLYLSSALAIADHKMKFIFGGVEVNRDEAVEALLNQASNSLGSNQLSQTEDESVETIETLPYRNILWVDDNPIGNIVEREALIKLGLEITAVTTTKAAMDALKKNPFDVIISDMGRTEEGIYKENAGLEFLTNLGQVQLTAKKIIIYCAKKLAIKYAEQAKNLGASNVVYSPWALMKSLGVKKQ